MTRFEELSRQIEANANTGTPMPEYQCHKKVWALKIKEIVSTPDGAIIVPEGHFGPIAMGLEFVIKHKPEVGGYLVSYKDGYRSFSPAEAFEEGYTRI